MAVVKGLWTRMRVLPRAPPGGSSGNYLIQNIFLRTLNNVVHSFVLRSKLQNSPKQLINHCQIIDITNVEDSFLCFPNNAIPIRRYRIDYLNLKRRQRQGTTNMNKIISKLDRCCCFYERNVSMVQFNGLKLKKALLHDTSPLK